MPMMSICLTALKQAIRFIWPDGLFAIHEDGDDMDIWPIALVPEEYLDSGAGGFRMV